MRKSTRTYAIQEQWHLGCATAHSALHDDSAFTILNRASRPGLIICVILIADPPTGIQLITSGTPPVLYSIALISIYRMK